MQRRLVRFRLLAREHVGEAVEPRLPAERVVQRLAADEPAFEGVDECSDTTVGRRMWHLINEPPELLLAEVVRATLLSDGNRG